MKSTLTTALLYPALAFKGGLGAASHVNLRKNLGLISPV
jgi:hypothetical protein